MRVKVKKLQKAEHRLKPNLYVLRYNQEIREKYTIAVQNKVECLYELQDIEDNWDVFKSALNESVNELVPARQNKEMKTSG